MEFRRVLFRSGRIDWRQNAIDIDRLIRAAGRPYPGAWSSKGAKSLVVWAARPWAAGGRHLAQPGQIIMRDQSGSAVACGGETALYVTVADYQSGGLHAMKARFWCGTDGRSWDASGNKWLSVRTPHDE